jgi:hypothetical protein
MTRLPSVITFLALACGAVSCDNPTEAKPSAAVEAPAEVAAEVAAADGPPDVPVAADSPDAGACPEIAGALTSASKESHATVADMSRHSKKKDADGNDVPPYESADLDVHLPKPIACGQKVSVLPLSGWKPTEAEVRDLEASERIAGETSYVMTVRSFEPEYLSGKAQPDRRDDIPTNAVVIFPAAPSAKLLSLTPPPGLVAKGNPFAIVDADGDGEADIVFSAKPLADLGDCQYQYRRDGKKWKLLDESCPD